jgi:hypothetical protein
MYSLTINFGPNGSAWALLFKTEEKAGEAYGAYMEAKMNGAERNVLIGSDDFGQAYAITVDEIHGVMLEDLDQTEAARIYRSLAEERLKIKFTEAAKNDPVLRHAMQQRPSVLTPGIR